MSFQLKKNDIFHNNLKAINKICECYYVTKLSKLVFKTFHFVGFLNTHLLTLNIVKSHYLGPLSVIRKEWGFKRSVSLGLDLFIERPRPH